MDKILLVLHPVVRRITDFYKLDLGYAHGIASYLDRVSDVTILLLCDIDVRQYESYLKTSFGFHVKVESLTEIDRLRPRPRDPRLVDYRPFVDISTQLFDYIAVYSYDCVIFDVFDAPGFIPIRAKKTGIGLEKTLLVSWLRTCHEFERGQALEAPDYLSSLVLEKELDFAEKYCCENCDLIISHTDSILAWTSEKEWNIDRNKVVPLTYLKTGSSPSSLADKTTEVKHLEYHESPEPNTTPLVSICVAHFNDGRNLRYLLKSVEDNDYKNFEVIVVDDGSTDNESLRIVESLANEYESNAWRFIFKKENESLGPTRNCAVSHARGEFILFLDSDDLAAKTLVSDLVRGMLKSGTDCLTCPLVYFEGEGGTVDNDDIVRLWMPLGAAVEIGIYDNPFGAANFCIKKSVFEALGGFRSPRGEVSEDWEFLARLVLSGFDMDVLPKALYFYRIRPGSWLQTAWSHNSIQNLRRRILSNFGPQHTKVIHDLLLRSIAENDRLRASVWKMDRKVVKIALKLVELISEEHRLLIENLSMRIYTKARDSSFSVLQFLKKWRLMLFNSSGPNRDLIPYSEITIDKSKFLFRSLTDSEIESQLKLYQCPSNRPIFGFVGELSEKSRPLGFLRLAYWMQMSSDNSFFLMVGDGEFREKMETTVTKYRLQNFKWIPFLEKPDEFYPLLSGLIVTGSFDQCPREILEALSCGVPVFSTYSNQAASLFANYGNGLVVKHDPERKDFADCFKLWKDNLEVYKAAAIETAELVRRNFGV